MATGGTMARNVASASPVGTPGRVPNLPVIEHPLSRLGDRHDLAVRGSSTTRPGGRKTDNPGVGLQRSATVIGGKGQDTRKSNPGRLLNWPPAVDIKPPFVYKDKPYKGVLPDIIGTEKDAVKVVPDTVDKFPKVGQIPKLPPLPSIEEQEEFLKGPGKPFVKSKEYNYQPRTTPELIELIREKFGTGYYGIRHLFKSNDPTGRGSVSREALQRILYTLCGYITPDQYSKLLKEIHLEGKPAIHFDTFVQFFKENEDKKDWVGALQTKSLYQPSESSYPESYLKRADLRIHDPYTSMPFSDAIFKEKCKSKNFDAHKVFPGSVFEAGGLILPPQLREAYATLGIYMTDEDFNKLWQRYDKEGTRALHTDDFFRICGLDPQGRPKQAAPYTPRGAAYPRGKTRPHSEIGHTNGLETSREAKKVLKKEGAIIDDKNTNNSDKKETEPVVDVKDAENSKDTGAENTQSKKIQIRKTMKVAPKLDNIIDCLHYKFEESYQAMLTAFQLFDFLNDNYISKIDYRRVLQEFGFHISPSELEHFLRKNGLRTIKGQLNYRDFLSKFQNKSDTSVTAKIAKDNSHPFHADNSTQTDLTTDVLESRLVDHFHGDFIKLLSHFRQCDKYNLGVITPHEFRSGIERRLGYSMTETQWDQLKQDVGQDKDGLLCYTKFQELFDVTPGTWNIVQEGNIQVTQIVPSDLPVPAPVDRLRERAKTDMVPPSPPPAESFRSLEEVQVKLDELFKNKFHTFDKHFKSMDRRMTGRMSKWQFGALLKMSGLALQPKELDRLWATLNLATDGMYSYSTLIQHFINYKVPHEEKETVVYGNMFNVDEEDEIWWDSEEDTSELVETAKRIQRERREEKMQRDHLARMNAREKNEEWKPETPRRVATAASHTSSIPSVPPSRASFSSVQSVRTKSLLVKIRTDVVSNWDGLKSVFKYIDKNGTASIPLGEMKEIMNSMHFSIDEEEKSELCKRFDTQKNGRFNYLQFMKCYAQRQEKNAQAKPQVYSKYTHQLETQHTSEETKETMTVQNVIECLRKKLFKEHRNLRRAFKKLDVTHKGYLTVQDFKKALRMCNVSYSNEDFYHIMTEFDHNLDGRITYDHFLRTLLTA